MDYKNTIITDDTLKADINKLQIKNKDKILDILRSDKYLSATKIATLVGCSIEQASKLRIDALATYMPNITPTSLRKENRVYPSIRTKVRIDKFLKYYDDKQLLSLYRAVWGCSY